MSDAPKETSDQARHRSTDRDEPDDEAPTSTPSDAPTAADDEEPADSEPDSESEPDEDDPDSESAPDEDEPDSESAPDEDEPASRHSWQPKAIVGPRAAYGLALLTGVLYFLGYPGIDLWPISLIALAPMIVALRGQPIRRATGIGWLAGFTMTMIGFYWLLEMLKVFSGFPTVVCALFMAVLCGYQAGRIALCGFLYGAAARRGWPAPLVFAGAFAASELVYPLLFPWYFGASVHNAPVLMQTAELGGPILVGLVLVAANLAAAELLGALLLRTRIDKRVVAVGVVVPVLAALFGWWRIAVIDERAAQSEPVMVGMVQGNSPLKNRSQAARVHRRLTRQLRKEGAQLVVWSEAAVSGFFPEKDHQRVLRRAVTNRLGVPTIVGTVLHRPIEGAGPKGRKLRFFNTALMADDKGNIHGRYDKQFLLMFGEYLPLGETFPILYEWSPNTGGFTPGTSMKPLEHDGHRYAVTICYEDIIPSFVNELVREGDPDLLVNMTNDTWFGDSTEPWIHLALAKFRTVEHRRYLARVTNSGVTALVDAAGRVVVHSSTFTEEALLGSARYMRGHTVYQTLGDIPWWLITAAMVAGCFVRRPRRKSDPGKA